MQEIIQHVSVHSGSNWNLAVLVFLETGKLEYVPREKPLQKNCLHFCASLHCKLVHTRKFSKQSFAWLSLAFTLFPLFSLFFF